LFEALRCIDHDGGRHDLGNGNGTLDKFHLGVSADGRSCMMILIDENRHAIRCTADFAQFNAFIANLNRAAAEMARAATGLTTKSRRAAAP